MQEKTQTPGRCESAAAARLNLTWTKCEILRGRACTSRSGGVPTAATLLSEGTGRRWLVGIKTKWASERKQIGLEPLLAGTKGCLHGRRVTIIPTDAKSMTAVASHPASCRYRGSLNCPITFRFRARIIMNVIKGTATTPLSTADQNSALIGFRRRKLSVRPIKVAMPIVP